MFVISLPKLKVNTKTLDRNSLPGNVVKRYDRVVFICGFFSKRRCEMFCEFDFAGFE